jgi:hypothetical protein
MNTHLPEKATQLLHQLDPQRVRKSLEARPAMIELFGTPKAGKSTIKEMLKLFFKRNGWLVSAPTEGAEVVEWPAGRREPDYNFATAEYALAVARERAFGPGHGEFHLVIFDRGIFDGVMRMDHYEHKGVMSTYERRQIEGYYLNRWNRQLFDAHVCLVCSPEVAMERELARAIIKADGETMNHKTLSELRESHDRIWKRLRLDRDPRMSWHDTTAENPGESALAVLKVVLAAIAQRPELSGK